MTCYSANLVPRGLKLKIYVQSLASFPASRPLCDVVPPCFRFVVPLRGEAVLVDGPWLSSSSPEFFTECMLGVLASMQEASASVPVNWDLWMKTRLHFASLWWRFHTLGLVVVECQLIKVEGVSI